MKTIHRFSSTALTVLGLAALFLVLVPGSAFAQKPTKDRMVYEDHWMMMNPCNNEMIHITDRYQVITAYHPDKDGCDRYKFHVNDMGTKGVSESGAKYQFPYAYMSHASTSCDGCIYSETYTVAWQLVGQGKAPNFKVHATVRLTYNACTDELTIVRENVSITCDGEPLN
ncbi:MAG: hypothetical protein HY962_09280 [Ignavibacteriae bacterium]|nr:hypothetical protein [Ignavibacteriota bacterium]